MQDKKAGRTKAELEELGVSAAKGGGIFVTGKIVGAVITLVLFIFLARYLQPVEYGIYTIATSFATFIALGGHFGFATAARKMIPEQKSKAAIGRIIGSSVFMTAIISLAITAAGLLASSAAASMVYGNPSLTLPLMAASATVFLSVMLNLFIALLVAMGKERTAAYMVLAYSAIWLVSAVTMVLLGYGVFGAILGMAIGFAVSIVAMLAPIIRPFGLRLLVVSRKQVRELMDFSIPIAVSRIAQTGMQYFGIAFLGAFVTAFIVGNFGTAFNLGNFVEVFLTSSTFILLPVFSGALSRKSLSKRIESIYNNSLYYSLLILLPIVAFGAATAVPLVSLLFSSGYSVAPLYFSLIIIGATVNIIASYAGTMIIGYGDSRKFMRYQAIGVAVQLALVLALVPFFGAIGLIVALFAISPIVLGAIYTRALRRQFRIAMDYNRVTRAAIAAVILGALLLAVTMSLSYSLYSIPVNAVLAIAVYPPLLAYTGAISERQLGFLSKVAERSAKMRLLLNLTIRYVKVFLQ